MPKVVKPRGFPWKLSFTVVAWGLLAASAGVAAKTMQNFVLADKHFALPSAPAGITFEGVHYASKARIAQAFAADFGRSAFRIPMAERRRRLLGVDWVDDVSITRVWPNHLIVRVKERKPVAFVSLSNGRFLLIDEAGILLNPPPKVRFDFPVLSGISEEQSEEQRSARVGAMSLLLAELGPSAKQISEVNAASLEDLRVTAQIDRRAVELYMGDRNFAPRFQNFMNHYAEIAKGADQVRSFDLRLDDRITTK